MLSFASVSKLLAELFIWKRISQRVDFQANQTHSNMVLHGDSFWKRGTSKLENEWPIEVLHGSHVAWQEQLTLFLMGKSVLSFTKCFRPFYIVCLVTWPLNGREAAGDLVLILGSLSTDVFEPRTSTGSLCFSFSTFSCPTNELPSSHFSIYNLIFSTKSELYAPKRRSFDFRLTSVAQKRLCLNYLLISLLLLRKSSCSYADQLALQWEKQRGLHQSKVTSSLTFIHGPGD